MNDIKLIKQKVFSCEEMKLNSICSIFDSFHHSEKLLYDYILMNNGEKSKKIPEYVEKIFI